MPIMRCIKDGKKGYKWGKKGVCFIGPEAKDKALDVAKAIFANKNDAVPDNVSRIFSRRSTQLRQRRKRKLGKVPVWRHPRKVERFYEKELLNLVERQHILVEQIIYTHLPGLSENARLGLPRNIRSDAWPNEVERLLDLLENRVDRLSPELKALTINVGQRVNSWNDSQWRKTLKAVLGVELFIREPWLLTNLESFTIDNVKLISSLQGDNLVAMEGILHRSFRAGDRHETIRKKIEEQFGKTRNRASLIARDQVSKLNGQLTRLRQSSIGVRRYIWHDSDDNRVRISHSQNDDLLMSWSDPTIYYPSINAEPVIRLGVHLHPGEDYQCRCWAEAFFDDIANEFNMRPRARSLQEAEERRNILIPNILRGN